MSELGAAVDPRAATLDDPAVRGRLDPHDVGGVLGRFPAQCREAQALRPVPEVRSGPPPLVVVAGMGGSAAGGDLVSASAGDRLRVPVLTHRGYGLPAGAGPGTLVIAVSYSGDTVEAVSAFEAALAAGTMALAVTQGGRLGALAARHRAPLVTLPGGLPPRLALGYLFFPLLGILASAGLLTPPPSEVAEALEVVETLAVELGPGQPSGKNEAKHLALEIGDRTPVAYGGQLTGAVAYRWKTDIEENAKRLAVAGALPEMNHNEIEAWRAPEAGRLHAILLRDRGAHPDIGRGARGGSRACSRSSTSASGPATTWRSGGASIRGRSRCSRRSSGDFAVEGVAAAVLAWAIISPREEHTWPVRSTSSRPSR